MKSKLLKLSLISTIVAPVAAVVSCGSNVHARPVVNQPAQEIQVEQTKPSKANINLKSIVKTEAVAAKYNIDVPFSDSSFTVKKSTDGEYALFYNEYNRGWTFNIENYDATTLNDLLTSIANDVKQDIEFNKPSVKENITLNEKKEYVGYIYKRYVNEVWKDKYKDFSVLTNKFPYMSIEHIHHAKGAWTTETMIDVMMWKGLIKASEQGHITKEQIIARTELDQYKIHIGPYVYSIFFDKAYDLPEYLRRKLITDMLVTKQWGFQILRLEGVVFGGHDIGGRSFANHFAMHVKPWTNFKNKENLTDLEAFENFYSISNLEEHMLHEFGHNTSFTMRNNEEFTDGNFATSETREFTDMYSDTNRFLGPITDALKGEYDDISDASTSKHFDKLYKNPYFTDMELVAPNGNFYDYPYSLNHEYITELARMFDEAPFLEPSNFFNYKESFVFNEVSRCSAYLDLYGTPVWDRETGHITEHGSAYRDQYRENIIGYNKETVVTVEDASTSYTNFYDRLCITGASKDDFDFLVIEDADGNTFNIQKTLKLEAGQNNYFDKQEFFSRDQIQLIDNRISFAAVIPPEQNTWGSLDKFDIHFYKDTNKNGTYDSNDTLTETKEVIVPNS